MWKFLTRVLLLILALGSPSPASTTHASLVERPALPPLQPLRPCSITAAAPLVFRYHGGPIADDANGILVAHGVLNYSCLQLGIRVSFSDAAALGGTTFSLLAADGTSLPFYICPAPQADVPNALTCAPGFSVNDRLGADGIALPPSASGQFLFTALAPVRGHLRPGTLRTTLNAVLVN